MCTVWTEINTERGSKETQNINISGEKLHKCTECGQRFARKDILSSHMTSIHIGRKPHECTQSGQRFALKGNLSRHITSVHTGEKLHECTECDKAFANCSNLVVHMRTQQG